MTAPTPSNCPRCDAPMQCGMVNGDSECWCFALPHSVAVPAEDSSEEARCLCPTCLKALMDAHDLRPAAD